MKTRKKYFIAHFVTDLYFMDDEYEMFYAESPEAVEQEMRKDLGDHLLLCDVYRASWAERRRAKRAHHPACVI